MASKGSSRNDQGILARVTQSPIVYKGKKVAEDATYVAKKLGWSTGKAAWALGTTFLILVVPLIIEMDRDAQFAELEMQQGLLLGTPPPAMPPK